MFKELGIRGRVLLLTLLPASLLALVLGGYFTGMQLFGMHAELLQRGQMTVEQLAPLSAAALAGNDEAQLRRAVDQVSVAGVPFYVSYWAVGRPRGRKRVSSTTHTKAGQNVTRVFTRASSRLQGPTL